MKKSRFAALFLAALTAAVQAEPLNYNVVEFVESATVSVPRDTMTAVFTVRAEAREREAAHRAFAAKMNAFSRRAADKALEVSEANRSSHPVYSYPDNKRVQTGWQESIEYTVKSQDFTALNRLIAQSQKDAEVQNTHFTLSPQKRNAAVDEASRAALLRFKDRAVALAQTLGFSGYKIVSLKLGELGDAPVMMMSAKAGYAAPVAADSATAAPPSPGIEEIRITVNGSVQM